jgi:uncharacterized protein (TIGR03000 family)
MVQTGIRKLILPCLVSFLALVVADAARAGCGWLHGRGYCGDACCSSAYGSWEVGPVGYGYGIDGYGDSGYGSPGYTHVGYGAPWNGFYGPGYYQPRYYTRLDYPQYWGWSNGISGRHIWGHWYRDGGIWGVPSVSAAIRAYGPSRYYPSYQGMLYGRPSYGVPSIYHGAQAKGPAANPATFPSPKESRAVTAEQANRALLTVLVPEEASVFVNGRLTTSRGPVRKFESAGLQPGMQYAYEVRAEVERNGQRVSDVQNVNLRAGEAQDLVFNFESAEAPETSLTLHVPEDAKVELSGVPTTTTGAIRTYATTGLLSGQSVSDYTIRVSVERFGRVLVEEKTVNLRAGHSASLAFRFDESQLAGAVR